MLMSFIDDVDAWANDLGRPDYSLTEAERTFGHVLSRREWMAECAPRDPRFSGAQFEFLSSNLARPVGIRAQLRAPSTISWLEACLRWGQPHTEFVDRDGWGQPTHWMFCPTRAPRTRIFLTVASRDLDSAAVDGMTVRWFPPGT